ncbi:relaxase domain-containing protein [Streptomyces sp. NBC_01530]|uniref:relaxase domain-containing protein n=1 Tax=Streptomyces sp. NBC_01530 TaxID=2903895 RepID=UPI00386D28F1
MPWPGVHTRSSAAGQPLAGEMRCGGVTTRPPKVTGFDLAFCPQTTLSLLWALGGEETRRVIEAAHERAAAPWRARAAAPCGCGTSALRRAPSS